MCFSTCSLSIWSLQGLRHIFLNTSESARYEILQNKTRVQPKKPPIFANYIVPASEPVRTANCGTLNTRKGNLDRKRSLRDTRIAEKSAKLQGNTTKPKSAAQAKKTQLTTQPGKCRICDEVTRLL